MNKEQKIQELSNKIENSQAEIDELKKELEELQDKPYEISYPIGYALMWYLDDCASVTSYQYYNTAVDRVFYESGLLFDTKEEAEQFLKEQTLIKKIKCWVKEQQRDCQSDWSNTNQRKYCVGVDRFIKETICDWCRGHDKPPKLPHFKSQEIVQACIDEFGDEILEVFC
jgi:hypothetical protein